MVTSEKLEYSVVDELVGVDAPEEIDVVELGQGDAVVVDQVGQAEKVLNVPGAIYIRRLGRENTKVEKGTGRLRKCA